MSNTHTFIVAGADANDADLASMIRSSFLAQRTQERAIWLRQIELGLDGYGDRHRDIVARIHNVLRLLSMEQRA